MFKGNGLQTHIKDNCHPSHMKGNKFFLIMTGMHYSIKSSTKNPAHKTIKQQHRSVFGSEMICRKNQKTMDILLICAN